MRQPPHDLDVEKSLLATMIMSEPHEVSLLVPKLSEDCFMHPSHRAMFYAIKALAGSGVPIDVLSVWQELQRSGQAGNGFRQSYGRADPVFESRGRVGRHGVFLTKG